MLRTYLKLAIKVLFRRKFFTAISLFGISFTLVVLMVVAGLVDQMVAPAAPETRLDRTLFVNFVVLQGEEMRSSGPPGYLLLERCARNLPAVEMTSFYTQPTSVVTYENDEKLVLQLRRTDAAYWQILDFDFVEGGPLTAEDDAGADPVAIITESAKARYFRDEKPAVGRTLEVDGRSFRVKGVVEDVNVARRAAHADVWIPNSVTKSDRWKTQMRGDFEAMLVAGRRSDFKVIQEEFQARLGRLELPDPEYNTAKGWAVTRFGHIAKDTLAARAEEEPPVARLVALLAGFGLLFMLLPAINLVNINMSRIFERASEIGVRKSFGASSVELVKQFMVENLVLSLVGGLIGLLGSVLVLFWLNRSGIVPGAELVFHPRIFLYALLLSIIFGVVSGIYPAWRMSRLDPVAALRGGAA